MKAVSLLYEMFVGRDTVLATCQSPSGAAKYYSI